TPPLQLLPECPRRFDPGFGLPPEEEEEGTRQARQRCANSGRICDDLIDAAPERRERLLEAHDGLLPEENTPAQAASERCCKRWIRYCELSSSRCSKRSRSFWAFSPKREKTS